MFIKCKLRLTQNNHPVDVDLEKAVGTSFIDLVTYWGKCDISEGDIPKERQQWVYTQSNWQLMLLDGGGKGIGMGGGGLEYAELAALGPAAILSRAMVTSRGVESVTETGVGEVLKAAEISVYFKPGPMTWQLLAFRNPGQSGWQNP